MHYFSLNHNAPKVSFDEAVIRGIAPDKGLYFPEAIPQLPESFWQGIDQMSKVALATTLQRA